VSVPSGCASDRFLLEFPDSRTPDVTGPDWTGLPPRAVARLGRSTALAVLDARRDLQEEYLEWRAVHGADGRLERVELTTELPDFWRVLAANDAERTLDLIGQFVGRSVEPTEVYGGPVPDTATAREEAFVAAMIETSNPLNDGGEGILFMCHRENDLYALFKIAAAAARPRLVVDDLTGCSRCATAAETIPLIAGAAVAGRASDPVIVERLGRLAFEGRLIALARPPGIFIVGVEHTRQCTPDGVTVPPDWFSASRGLSAEESPDGHARSQRLVLEAPSEHGLVLGDLVDVATEQPLRHGGQVAELTQLRLLLRTSASGVVE
jgi:hypothetical protein